MSTTDQQKELFRRHVGFGLFFVGSVAMFWAPLKNLISLSLTHDTATHIMLIAPVSACLVYRKQSEIFSIVKTGRLSGPFLFLTGTILWWFAEKYADSIFQDYQLSAVTLAIVIIWISGFLFFYGTTTFVKSRFPLLFLLLLVPLPALAVEKITFVLQAGSASVAYGLLRLLSVPVLKQGFIMRLPTLDIEVAKECSGIRSSLALLITTLLVGEFALRSAWKRTLLVICILPILILKNAARIVSISLLSIYVDRRFLHGWLHTSGGIVFYLLGLAILVPIVMVLRKSEEGNFAARDLQLPGPVS